jgi:hypothetical protein
MHVFTCCQGGVGSGWGFGIHEAIHETMDQIGAVVGSLILSIILYFKGSYSESFLIPNSVFLYFPNTFIKYCLIFLVHD